MGQRGRVFDSSDKLIKQAINAQAKAQAPAIRDFQDKPSTSFGKTQA